MTDEAQVSDTQPVVEQTLDQVIESFDVQVAPKEETNVTEFKPAQAPQLDVYDEGSLNKWASDTQANQDALRSEIQNLKADADARNAADGQKVIDADIKSAVDVITKGIEGIDPLSAEILLEKTARENEGFKRIWQNRSANPKAYKAALSAIVNDNESKFQRIDTQIAENHRAAQLSTQSNNTQKAAEYGTTLEEQLANAKTEGERQVIWANGKGQGY